MESGNQETHALLGNRSAYEAKHSLAKRAKEARLGDARNDSLDTIHSEILRKTQERARELHTMTKGLNDRLASLGQLWQELVGSIGDDLNEKINNYIDGWAEIDKIFQELESKKEFGRETESQKILRSFEDFMDKHSDLIVRELRQGKNLESVFYDNFYSEDVDAVPYREGDPAYEIVRKNYRQDAKQMLDKFLALSQKYQHEVVPAISPGKKSIEGGWVYFKLNGGTSRSVRNGRFYLNIKPEQLVKFYENALPILQRLNLHIDAKISQTANPANVNRYDKMIVYFNEEEERAISIAIEELHSQNPQIFLDGNPKFTAQLADSRGKPMVGVSFGEEPGRNQYGESFGEVRSKILAEVYKFAQEKKYKISDPRVQNHFRIVCTKYDVDSNNPAFNAGESNFKFIKNNQKIN